MAGAIRSTNRLHALVPAPPELRTVMQREVRKIIGGGRDLRCLARRSITVSKARDFGEDVKLRVQREYGTAFDSKTKK